MQQTTNTFPKIRTYNSNALISIVPIVLALATHLYFQISVLPNYSSLITRISTLSLYIATIAFLLLIAPFFIKREKKIKDDIFWYLDFSHIFFFLLMSGLVTFSLKTIGHSWIIVTLSFLVSIYDLCIAGHKIFGTNTVSFNFQSYSIRVLWFSLSFLLVQSIVIYA